MDPRSTATEQVLRAGRRLGSRGLISAGEGNISVRLDADRLLVTPTGLRKDELEPDDLVVVWLGHPDREAVSRSGSRPDLGPGDPPRRPRGAAGARGGRPRAPARGDGPDPGRRGAGPGGPARDGPVPAAPAVPVARTPGSSASWPDRVAAALTEPPEPLAAAVLLERHGAVCGRSRSRPGGRPARARRGPLPDVARCAFDSRGAGQSLGIVAAPRPSVADTEGT